MREVWSLQPKFNARYGSKPSRLITHPRFRAGYDFLLLRAETGGADLEVAEWWGKYQVANDNEQRLPSGASESTTPDGVSDDSIPVFSGLIRTQMIQYAGNYKVLGCPNLKAPFNTETGWYHEPYGFVLGYNYLGGHAHTPWAVPANGEAWFSPQKLTDTSTNLGPSTPLITDMNDWSPGYGSAIAPHTAKGPIALGSDFNTDDPQGQNSANLGSLGGNVGLMDGSVSWKGIKSMKIHRGSQRWGNDGCSAMW